jgi:Ca2+-transporting ATPase
LEAGNYVPADVRLLESANLQIDEASLTGESVPVSKDATREIVVEAGLGDRKTMAYKSTIATYGRGKAVVVATGMQTEIGKIAELIQSVEEEETPLQRRLDSLGKSLAYAALAICGVVFLLAFWRTLEAHGLSVTELFGSLNDPVVLEESARCGGRGIPGRGGAGDCRRPRGLPAIVTMCLALGMRRWWPATR